ncbi:MAG: aminotransferase class V-fold PLP-dependent enzyme [Candidatus Eisenbacteria bacterium]
MASSATDAVDARRALWALDPEVTFLNHGSFGACPRAVLEAQSRFRAQLESEPVRFFVRELEPLLESSRATLADFVGASPDDLVFVPNATAGVNTVLSSLRFAAGDELVVTNQEYNACRNALEVTAERCGAKVVLAQVPYPLASPDQVVEAVLAAVTPRTRLLLFDHVTSQTGLVQPLERVIREMNDRGIDVLVDGAHAPGMVPLDLARLGVTYYTGNCHKWICAPKGAAFLFVRRDRQDATPPLVISHGWNSTRNDRSRFRLLHDWTGTWDPTPYLCVGEAIRYLGGLLPGGWDEVRSTNRALALEARSLLAAALDAPLAAPDEMIGSLATVPLPPGPEPDGPPRRAGEEIDPLQEALWQRHQIEVPIVNWPAPPARIVRVSAQLYNRRSDYERLAAALVEEIPRG